MIKNIVQRAYLGLCALALSVKETIKDTRAVIDISTVVGLVVTLIVMAVLMPMALDQFATHQITGNATLQGLWNLIPVFALLGLVIGVISLALNRDILKKTK